MSRYPHLRNAPIVEALIDIQVNPRADLEISAIRKFRESVKEEYPKEQGQRALNISLSLGQSLKTTQTDEPLGFKYESADGLQVVQARDVPSMGRHVFLDNVDDPDYIRRQLARLADRARSTGAAIGIGHVGTSHLNTLDVLAEEIPRLKDQGFKFVYISELLRYALARQKEMALEQPPA